MRAFKFAAAVVAVAVGAWVIAFVLGLAANQNESSRDRADLRKQLGQATAQLDRQGKALDDANARLIQLGEEPVQQPAERPSVPSVLQGRRGLSCVEELGYPLCRGPKGGTGDHGKPGTDGATGLDGEPGANGADGAPGKNGADGKDGAQGPQGEPGPAGPAGPAGTALPGNYACPDGQYLNGFAISGDGSVSLSCQTVPIELGGNKP